MAQRELRQRIRVWLVKNNVSYEDLAKRLNVSLPTIRNWMSQKPIPDEKVYLIQEMLEKDDTTSLQAWRKTAIAVATESSTVQETGMVQINLSISLSNRVADALREEAEDSGYSLDQYLRRLVEEEGARVFKKHKNKE